MKMKVTEKRNLNKFKNIRPEFSSMDARPKEIHWRSGFTEGAAVPISLLYLRSNDLTELEISSELKRYCFVCKMSTVKKAQMQQDV